MFPRADTAHYLQYMTTNYYDLLLAAWERRYGNCRQEGRQRLATAASNKVHLAVPASEQRIRIVHKSPKLFKRKMVVPNIFKDK